MVQAVCVLEMVRGHLSTHALLLPVVELGLTRLRQSLRTRQESFLARSAAVLCVHDDDERRALGYIHGALRACGFMGSDQEVTAMLNAIEWPVDPAGRDTPADLALSATAINLFASALPPPRRRGDNARLTLLDRLALLSRHAPTVGGVT